MRTMRIDQARRLALGAQGFAVPRPRGRVDVRHLRRTLALNQVVQLDSVNVAARAHYLPFFSRLGPYDRQRLDRWLWRSRENFEYWGHQASVMPIETHRLLCHRMQQQHPWNGVQRLAEEHPGYIEQVRAEVAADGPLTVSDLAAAGRRGGSWWGWNPGRTALDWLFMRGELAVDRRDNRFTLHYDLHDRVIPAWVREQPELPEPAAHRALLLIAARAHGVGTAPDLADHWRIPIRDARSNLEHLADEGRLERVRVQGWDEVAYRHPEVPLPRRVEARALISPFDPVVWFRDRAARLFGFDYRIEIYVPRQRRRYGYYVLPFLLGDRLVARVDLKADRNGGALQVLGAFAEAGADVVGVARELTAELRTMAGWLGLGEVAVADHGDLAPALRRAAD